MASDSLGTMTVGVTANVSDAERALNSLANMLEKFDRQQQTRARSASSGARGAGAGGGGYFSPMSEEFNAEIRRMEMVQKRTESTLRFRQIRQSEMAAVSGRGTEENMRALGEAFKSGDIERLEGVLGRANRGIQQVGDSSARTRYAVLNLGYGVQDAVQVFGTSGLAGAVRASANNLQGLGILLDKTAGGMAGLKSALMSGEFIVMGVATAVLLAASAWESYAKSVQDAMDLETKDRLKRLKPERNVEEAGRREALDRELAQITKLADADKKRKELADAVAVANEKLNQANREEIDLKTKIATLRSQIAEAFAFEFGGQADLGVPNIANERQQAAIDAVEAMGGLEQAKNNLKGLQKQLDDFIGTKGENGAIEQIIRDRDNAQKDLRAAEERVQQLQPNAVENARKELKVYQDKLKHAERLADLHNVENRKLEDDIKKHAQMEKLAESAAKKQKEGAEWLESQEGRGRRRANVLGQDPGMPRRFVLTPGERAALQYMNEFEMSDEAQARLKRDKMQPIPIAEELMKFAKDKIEGVFKVFPQLKPDRTLEQQENDMEYRLQFLKGKRRDALKDLRVIEKGTPAAGFESSQAYEALARARMNTSPEQDRLNKILAAEERSAKALEDIREKLDPGRRERLVILESFE